MSHGGEIMEVKSINGMSNYKETPVVSPAIGKTPGTVTQLPVQKKEAAENMDMSNGQANEQQIKTAVEKANKALVNSKTRCEFSYHESTKSISIKIIDEQTKEVLREVPPEKILDMIGKMWEMAGILVDEKR